MIELLCSNKHKDQNKVKLKLRTKLYSYEGKARVRANKNKVKIGDLPQLETMPAVLTFNKKSLSYIDIL